MAYIDCVLAADIVTKDFTVTSDYSGDIDFADLAYSANLTGDVTAAGTGTLDFGTAIITGGGDWDTYDQTTINAATSTVTLTGTAKILRTATAINASFYNLICDGTYTASVGGFDCAGYLTINAAKSLNLANAIYITRGSSITHTINGTLTVGSGRSLRLKTTNGTLIVGSAGTITGDGMLYTDHTSAITIDNTAGGTIDIATCRFWRSVIIAGSATIASATVLFDADTTGTTATLGTAAAQVITFLGAVTITVDLTHSYTFDLASYNPELVFHGNVTVAIAGTFTWSKGSGSITFTGSNTQNIDFAAEAVEAISIDKAAGTLTLTGDVTTDALTFEATNAGTFDLGAIALVVVGDIIVAGTGDIDWGTGTVNAGGDVDWTAYSLNWTEGTTVWTFSGKSKSLKAGSTLAGFNTGIFANNYTLDSAGGAKTTFNTAITINTGMTVEVLASNTLNTSTASITVNGTLTGAGALSHSPGPSDSLTMGPSGQITITTMHVYPEAVTAVMDAATYSPGTLVFRVTRSYDVAARLQAGTYVFDCDVQFAATNTGDLTIDVATNAPTIEFRKNVTQNNASTGYSYFGPTAGGSIKINGTGDQSLDFTAATLGDVASDKVTGRATFAADAAMASFTGVNGDCDLNGYTLTVTGNVVLGGHGGFRLWNGVDASQSNGVFDYGGSLTAYGIVAPLLTILDLDFVNTVADSSYVEYADVTSSTRTGTGADIDAATGPGNVDGGGNVGWDFGSAVIGQLYMVAPYGIRPEGSPVNYRIMIGT